MLARFLCMSPPFPLSYVVGEFFWPDSIFQTVRTIANIAQVCNFNSCANGDLRCASRNAPVRKARWARAKQFQHEKLRRRL
jgi:hypothetical protein